MLNKQSKGMINIKKALEVHGSKYKNLLSYLLLLGFYSPFLNVKIGQGLSISCCSYVEWEGRAELLIWTIWTTCATKGHVSMYCAQQL